MLTSCPHCFSTSMRLDQIKFDFAVCDNCHVDILVSDWKEKLICFEFSAKLLLQALVGPIDGAL